MKYDQTKEVRCITHSAYTSLDNILNLSDVKVLDVYVSEGNSNYLITPSSDSDSTKFYLTDQMKEQLVKYRSMVSNVFVLIMTLSFSVLLAKTVWGSINLMKKMQKTLIILSVKGFSIFSVFKTFFLINLVVYISSLILGMTMFFFFISPPFSLYGHFFDGLIGFYKIQFDVSVTTSIVLLFLSVTIGCLVCMIKLRRLDVKVLRAR